MAYVSCPMCGGPGAWEDSDTVVFCGPCEEKYQETAHIIQQEQDAAKAEWFDCCEEDYPDPSPDVIEENAPYGVSEVPDSEIPF